MPKFIDFLGPVGEAIGGFTESETAKRVGLQRQAEAEAAAKRQALLDELGISLKSSQALEAAERAKKIHEETVTATQEKAQRLAFVQQHQNDPDPALRYAASRVAMGDKIPDWVQKPTTPAKPVTVMTKGGQFIEKSVGPDGVSHLRVVPPPAGFTPPPKAPGYAEKLTIAHNMLEKFRDQDVAKFLSGATKDEQDFYRLTGKPMKKKDMSAQEAKDFSALGSLRRDAVQAIHILNELEANADPDSLNSLGGRIENLAQKGIYHAGFKPGQQYGLFIALLSRLGVESAGMVSRTSGGRLSVPVIAMLKEHIPDPSQSIALTKDKLKGILMGLQSAWTSLGEEVQLTTGKRSSLDFNDDLKSLAAEIARETGSEDQGVTLSLDEPPEVTH